jgi:N6-L-threonylcarbamoyladenine synthase
MLILSVDSSCDESCVSIFETESHQLLANVVYSHISSMQKHGGVVPEIASREHLKLLPIALKEALQKSKLTLKQIDWFTVTNGPGLIGALLVGVNFTKALAYALKKPFSVMNHIEGHLYSPLIEKTAPPFPWIALVVSGGHTELFLVKDLLDHQWLGGTLDDAAGEAFDKIGKLLELPYPAGPKLDNLVKQNAKNGDRNHFKFPRAKTNDYTFSFSGLKTAVSLEIKKHKLEEDLKTTIAASAQEAIVDALVEKVESTKNKLGVSQVVVAGGVACNSRLREKLEGAYFPSREFCSDNAAMIANLSALYHKKNQLKPNLLSETAYARLN